MLGFPRLSVLKSIFNKHSQPLGYTLNVSCFFDVYHVVLYFTFLVLSATVGIFYFSFVT